MMISLGTPELHIGTESTVFRWYLAIRTNLDAFEDSLVLLCFYLLQGKYPKVLNGLQILWSVVTKTGSVFFGYKNQIPWLFPHLGYGSSQHGWIRIALRLIFDLMHRLGLQRPKVRRCTSSLDRAQSLSRSRRRRGAKPQCVGFRLVGHQGPNSAVVPLICPNSSFHMMSSTPCWQLKCVNPSAGCREVINFR
jgi:hypothetical protein